MDLGDPQKGGTLRFAAMGTQLGYDPLTASADVFSIGLYDTLMQFGESGQVEPYLALSLESADVTTWELKLRPDVKFHDGNPLDADAVVFNIERHRDPKNASANFAYVEDITSVKAVDAQTVEIVLEAPNASFPSVLTTPVGMIASPKAVEKAGSTYGKSTAVGAGPFTFGEWKRDQITILKRNPNYWQEGLPYLDELHEIPMSDTQARLAAFQGGQADAAWFQEAEPIKWAKDNPSSAVLHGPKGSVGGSGLVFNMKRAPFDDVRIRKAVAHAVNYDALDKSLFHGTMPRITGPFSEDSVWYTGGASWPGYDANAAKELVKEYEAEKGPVSFTLSCHSAPVRVRYVEMLQYMLGEVGMEVEVDTPAVAEYVDQVFQQNYDVGCLPKNGADPDLAFYLSFTCDGPTNRNVMSYCDPKADDALRIGREATDFEDRKAAYADFEKLVAEELPMLWHWGDTFSIVTKTNVGGYKANPMVPTQIQPATLWLSK